MRYKELTHTNEYLKTIETETRLGHHNYVVDQELLNSRTALVDMNEYQVKLFDIFLAKKLKELDS